MEACFMSVNIEYEFAMNNLLVILRKPPYGVINAAEAVRHAGGASGFDFKAILYLTGSGVFSAKKDQDAGSSGFTGIGESLELLSDEMEIYACRNSLNESGIEEDDLIEGVRIDDGRVLKDALINAQSIMIY
jgi:sulfur relay (sulfurtransferase) DsrF/TusC family protein